MVLDRDMLPFGEWKDVMSVGMLLAMCPNGVRQHLQEEGLADREDLLRSLGEEHADLKLGQVLELIRAMI